MSSDFKELSTDIKQVPIIAHIDVGQCVVSTEVFPHSNAVDVRIFMRHANTLHFTDTDIIYTTTSRKVPLSRY
jgi:uncharacterized membrane protein YoaT (DUF817 family)